MKLSYKRTKLICPTDEGAFDVWRQVVLWHFELTTAWVSSTERIAILLRSGVERRSELGVVPDRGLRCCCSDYGNKEATNI